jgi:uncharacterized protein (TIGR00369 family)
MSIPSPALGSAAPRLDATRISELVDIHFPQIHAGGRTMLIEEVRLGGARVRMAADPRQTRPGGTISGAAMFALADFSMYVAIIASLGESGFDAVTSSLHINFLTRPAANDMTAVVKLIRLGRRSAVGEVELYSEGVTDMVAHATATYALPRA